MSNTSPDAPTEAFPMKRKGDDRYDPLQPGMTLRQWYAGRALGHIPELLAANDKNKSVQQIASWAFQVADAMIAYEKTESASDA